ncbi:hypothetical protein SMKI_15G2230 [Saccharomyces mikatae IFO 1815]|uniref:Shugoshin n=1 Tax=Saccharomyces mikatae IFO 1815 TaxID=226126 RepID=A0AA35ITT8_SACMI|nr:uncharacterized protein SMKI_15G2230 [Saccharomyces mikatae IFO 1815]CAI4036381.1 hypothetical protein SMKI_15G2230 [Saccharomyces mikatae IFO 1815]
MPKRKIVPNKDNSKRTVSHDDLTPQIQEFQNLMDLESKKAEIIRQSYSKQNSLLAKDNSVLKIKVNGLEKKISQLVQENVTLRSKTSISEAIYRERLSNQLQIIENGIIQRFDEIFYMFENVRKNENLPSSNLKSLLKRTSSRSRSCSLSSPTYSKNSNEQSSHQYHPSHESSFNKDDSQDLEPKTKKRKSSRRQSMFISTSLEPEDETIQQEPITNEPSLKVPVGLPESAQIEEATDTLNIEEEDNDSTSNFTNSIIEYSIPEENSTEPEHSSSKLEIFNDSTNILTTASPNHSSLRLPNPSDPPANLGATIGDTAAVYSSSSSSTNSHPKAKIKHSMKPPRIELKKKVIDEVMPVSNVSNNSEISFTRTRRTRGRAVDYTLPSLRAKMRRPSEKLVDATTVIDIHDLQVSNRNRETSHKRKSLSNDSIPDEPQLREVVVSKDYGTPNGKETEEQIHSNTTHPITTINNSSSQRKVENKSSNSSSQKSSPLLDITNKSENKRKLMRTKKLFKNAIVNNLSDENSTSRHSKLQKGIITDNGNNNNNNNSNFNSVNNKSVSFRLNEDDLAIFDLFGNGKTVKHQAKTYRTKK